MASESSESTVGKKILMLFFIYDQITSFFLVGQTPKPLGFYPVLGMGVPWAFISLNPLFIIFCNQWDIVEWILVRIHSLCGVI